MPKEIIRAFCLSQKAAALTQPGCRSVKEKSDLIGRVADEILSGSLDGLPARLWQTSGGTQSNMNVNEVIAYRGHVLAGGKRPTRRGSLHPNDDVNKSQSSNDVSSSHAYRHLSDAGEDNHTFGSKPFATHWRRKARNI